MRFNPGFARSAKQALRGAWVVFAVGGLAAVAQAKGILTIGGAPAPVTASQAAELVQAQQASALAVQAQNSLSRMTQALSAMQTMQSAARVITLAAPGSVPNGLQIGGLVPDSGLAAPGVARPVSDWVGAKTPTQTVAAGHTTVSVTQTAAQAILDWSSFNVGRDTTLAFQQSNASWTALNEIGGASPSQIAGAITARGQVYLINQNGIIFTGSSQIDVGALIASTAGITASQYLTNGIYSASTGAAAFANYTPSFTHAGAPVTVAAGAEITTATPASVTSGGGFVLLLGTTVDNAGSITTPVGQAELAAGDSFLIRPGVGSSANATSTTRGNEIAVKLAKQGSSATPGGSGLVTNNGLITADTGDITLAGETVVQNGVLLATTSVDVRGTIHLLSAASDPFSSVTLTGASTTAILPDLASNETALDSQRAGLIADSAVQNAARLHDLNKEFDDLGTLDDREDESRVEIVTGGTAQFAGNSDTLVTGGQVAVSAAHRIEVDGNATINVAGGAGVALPMSENEVSVSIEPNELRDDPQNRETGLLNSSTVSVETGDLVQVAPSAADSSARDYTPGGLLEVSGYLDTTGHGIGEWSALGGSIDLTTGAKGAVVTQPGSLLDVAGGAVNYQGGYLQQSYVVTAGGQIYNINNAPADITYAGVYDGFVNNHPSWSVEQIYGGGLHTPSEIYQQGYLVGRDAGSLVLDSPTALIGGTIEAAAPNGPSQTAPAPAGVSDPFLLGQQVVAQAGTLTLADVGGSGTLPTASKVTIGAGPGNAATLAAAAKIPAKLAGSSLLDAAALSADALGGLMVVDNGPVAVAAPLGFSPGATVGLFGASVDISASLSAPGGTVDISNIAVSGGTPTVLQDAKKVTGNITLARDTEIDTAGLWTNLALDPGETVSAANVNGGAVTLNSVTGLTLGAGSLIDASAGALVSAAGADTGGAGGNITLAAQTSSGEPLKGSLILNGSLESYGFIKGGVLAISAASFAIKPTLPAKPTPGVATPGVVTLDPAFFTRGFSAYDLNSTGAVTVAPGTILDVVEPVYQFGAAANAVPTGGAVTSGATLVLNPLFLANPTATKIIQRPGASLSVIVSLNDLVKKPKLGGIDIGAGAAIDVDPGQTIHLEAAGQLTVDGALSAPGGRIDLWSDDSLTDQAYTDGKLISVWLGGSSVIDASGDGFTATAADGASAGVAEAGGVIAIGNDDGVGASLGSTEAAIIIRKGAVIEASGAAAMERLASQQVFGFTAMPMVLGRPVELAGGGGTISISSEYGIFNNGGLSAFSGGATAAGGTLFYGLETDSRAGGTSLLEAVPRILTITQDTEEATLPAHLAPGEQDGALVDGTGKLSVAQITEGGFGTVGLYARDALRFKGDVSLAAAQAIELYRGAIVESDPKDSVTVAAPYVLLDGQTQIDVADTQGQQGTLIQAVSGYAKADAFGTFTVDAGLIDVRNSIGFGGVESTVNAKGVTQTTQLPGFKTEILNSGGDLRFLAPAAGTGAEATTLITTANLDLTAREIYAAGSNAVVYVGYDPTATGDDGTFDRKRVLTIGRAPGTTATAPLAIGGSLTLIAPTIRQGGVIWQPFGRIQFGGISTPIASGLPGRGDAKGVVDFLPGSLTSVSGAGLTIPYGGTTDGVNYSVNGVAVSAGVINVNNYGLVGVTGGVSPGTINVQALKTDVEAGATLDLSGGGVLTGEGFISGEGGSVDLTTTPMLSFGTNAGVTQPTLATDPVYAIVTGAQAEEAPAQVFTQTTTAGSTPALGEQIVIPSGVPGLPAGRYTLLPAAYALTPGGYRVELDGTASLAAPPVVTLPNGSYAVAGGTDIVNTSVHSTAPLAITITPAAQLTQDADYDQESYSQFLVSRAALFGAVRPVLPVDAGTLVLSLPGDSATSIIDNGTASFAAAPGGIGGTLQIAGVTFSTTPSIDFYGSSRDIKHNKTTVLLSAAAIDAFDPFILEVGAAGAGPQANVTGITLERGATLTAARVVLTALTGGITLKPGSGIDTLGRGTLSFDSTSRGDYTDNGASVLDVGNGYLAYSAPAGGNNYGPVTIDDGATLYTDGSIAFSTEAGVSIGVAANYGGRYLDFALPEINVGDPAAVGASAAAGLTLTQQVLQTLTAGVPGIGLPPVQILVLSAGSSLNFFGTTGLDLTQGNVQLVIDSPAIYGFGGPGDLATIKAGTIVWNGQRTTNAGTGVVGSGAPGGVLMNGPGTGDGVLDLIANDIIFGYSALDEPVRDIPLARLTLGFATVNLDAATEITANNQGTLSVYQSQAVYGAAGIGGTLNLNTPLLTAGDEARIGFTAGGLVDVAAPGGIAASVLPAAMAGGEVDLTGGSVTLDSAVILPSGKLDVQAAGNIDFGAASVVDLAGTVSEIFDKTVYGFGGELVAESAGGNITQNAGGVIDVAATDNTAGSLALTAIGAGNGAVALDGSLRGGATGGFPSGVFAVRAQTLDFAPLNAALNTGGFFQSRNFDIKQGDLVVGNGVIAHQVTISVDNGSLTVDGLIDAGGGNAGAINLAATGDLMLAGNAVLNAAGTTLAVDSHGQPIPAENTPDISLTSSAGTLTLATGATLDLASPDGVARGDLELNVPRDAQNLGDADIEVPGAVNIAGAATIAVNAFKTYSLPTTTGGSTLITQAYLDGINTNDSQPFMTAAATNADLAGRLAGLRAGYAGVLHLRPGVSIVSKDPNGDLTIQGDLDLSGYRFDDPAGYGARIDPAVYGSGEPGVLSIRAGGNLNIDGSITDGFAPPIDDANTEFAKGWVLYSGEEPYGQNIVVPTAVVLAKGTQLAVTATPVNYPVAIQGGTFQSGAATPVQLMLSGAQTVSLTFIATSNITTPSGRVYQAGTTVTAGTTLAKGTTIAVGGAFPFALQVDGVIWPANQPFLVTQGGADVVASAQVMVPAGGFIPGGSVILFPKGEAGVSEAGPNNTPAFFADGDAAPETFNTRPDGAGQLYALGQLLPAGDFSWSINLVSGADTTAANPDTVRAASDLAAAHVGGNMTLADAHYGTILQLITHPPLHDPTKPKNKQICMRDPASCKPTYTVKNETTVPAFSVIRTGTGALTLASGGAINEVSDYGIYTAGAQSAPILNASGGNPYNLPQAQDAPGGTLLGGKNAAIAALVANYQANYPLGGGNVTVAAQGDFAGFISTTFSPVNSDLNQSVVLTDTDVTGSWLWRQGGAGNPAAWWVEFGGLVIPSADVTSSNPSQDSLYAEMVGFQGVGTLGGGNVDVSVGGDASGLNLAVASTGRVAGNTLVQDGGGALNVTVSGALNFISPQFHDSNLGPGSAGDAGGLLADLRGDTTVSTGSVGIVTQNYVDMIEPNDPRTLPPLQTDVYQITNGINLAPGDGTVTVNSRGDLVVSGVADPGTVEDEVSGTPVFLTKNGVTTEQLHGGNAFLSLWSASTGINLFSAGGDIDPYEGGTGSETGNSENYYAPILAVTAQNGNIDFGLANQQSVELAPSAEGQLSLVAADSIFGAAGTNPTEIGISGADPSLQATPFDPAVEVESFGGTIQYSDFSPSAGLNPNGGAGSLAFGPDTPLTAVHAGGGQPALVYAGSGDIIDLQIGAVEPQFGQIVPSTWYLAAEPFDVQAGRDIVASGSIASPDAFLNDGPGDITTFQAGRDILESSIDIAGPGTLVVQAGRNLYEADQGTIYSIGPLFDIDPNNRDSGATIAVLAGAGAAGADYGNFAAQFLNPASTLGVEDASAVLSTDDAALYAWLQANYGYAGGQADAYTYFLTLSAGARDVFLRQLYFSLLNMSGLEFNESTSVRYKSYLLGKDAIAALFPSSNASGPVSYAGDITLFANSGIHTEFGGAIETLTPGGETLIGVEGTTPLGSAGLITEGEGDIDIYALASVELGESRVLTTFGGNILIWSAAGNIDAGRGSKTTVVFAPVQRVYDNYGNVDLSPSVPSTGAGIATLNPIPQVVAGDINLVAPQGTVDAGEAGIRVSGNLNIAALHVANSANISVQGSTSGVPHAPSVNTGALSAASNASGAAALSAQGAGNTKNQTAPPSIWIVEVLGYGGGSAPPPAKRKNVRSLQAFDGADAPYDG